MILFGYAASVAIQSAPQSDFDVLKVVQKVSCLIAQLLFLLLRSPPTPHLSYSDLCTPLGELCRLTALHSSPWEKKAESLKKTRSDYESMQRRLSIALKRLEMMSVEV